MLGREGWYREVPWPPGSQFSHLYCEGVAKAPVFLQILWVADTDSAWLTQQKSSYCQKGVFGATGGGAGSGRAGTRAAMGTWAAGGGGLSLLDLLQSPHPQVLAPLCLSFHILGGGAESVAQPPMCLSWARVGPTRCGHSGSAPVRGRGTVFPEGQSHRVPAARAVTRF